MAKKKTQEPKPSSADPSPDPPAKIEGSIVLVRDSIDARGQKCPAGTMIAPNVEGWPVHRVQAHIRNGVAK